MTGSGSRSTSHRPADDRLRLTLYELLHDRAENERKWQFRRLAAGHLVIGAIVAYAFVFEQWRFIALTPILYGVVVMDGLKYGVRMLYLQQQLVALEAKLADREPLFEWVTEYGFFGAGRRVEFEDVDLNRIPELAQAGLIGAIYVSLVAVSILAWTPLDDATSLLGVRVTSGVLLVGYGTFTLLFAAILLVGYLHYRRVQSRIEEIVASDG